MNMLKRIALATAITATAAISAGTGFAATAQAEGYEEFDVQAAILGDIDVLPAYPDPDYPGADPKLSLVTLEAEVCVNEIPAGDAGQGYGDTRLRAKDFTIYDANGSQVVPETGKDAGTFPVRGLYSPGECAKGTINFIVELSDKKKNWLLWDHNTSGLDNRWELPKPVR